MGQLGCLSLASQRERKLTVLCLKMLKPPPGTTRTPFLLKMGSLLRAGKPHWLHRAWQWAWHPGHIQKGLWYWIHSSVPVSSSPVTLTGPWQRQNSGGGGGGDTPAPSGEPAVCSAPLCQSHWLCEGVWAVCLLGTLLPVMASFSKGSPSLLGA